MNDDERYGSFVFERGGAWFVSFDGHLCAPTFNSRGAALGYLAMLKRGQRKPEYISRYISQSKEQAS
jgi:hypothetical protein